MSIGTPIYDDDLRVGDERFKINKTPTHKIDRKAVDSWTILFISPGVRGVTYPKDP